MRFLIIRKADNDTEAGVMPSEALIAAMMKYNEDLVNAGVILAGEGLHPTSQGARIKFSKGKPIVTDGPFAEAKEVIAGFTMIQVASRQEALEWAGRWPPLDGNGEVELELRQVFEADDFGTEFAPELRQQEARLRARSEQRAKAAPR
jgi:hypothetical protein